MPRRSLFLVDRTRIAVNLAPASTPERCVDRRIRLDGRSTGDSGGMAPATVEGTNRSRGTIMRIHSLAAFSLILAAIPATASAAPAGTVAAALAAPDRRPDNVKLDNGR